MNRFAVFLLMFLVLDCSFMGVAEAKKQAHKAKVAHHSPLSHAFHGAKKLVHSMQGQHHPAKHATTHHFLEEAGDDKTGEDKAGEDDEGPAKEDEDEDPADPEGEGEGEEKALSPSEEEKKKTRNMYIFLVVVFLVIVGLGFMCYGMAKSYDDKMTPTKFMGFDSESLDFKLIVVGMMSGVVFGMIDNGGLFFGMEYLDPLLAKLPHGDEHLVNSGYGNTFSDMIGAFMGTFVGKMIELQVKKSDDKFSLENAPIWTGAVGITIGCIIGVMIPRAIMGPPKKVMLSDNMLQALRAGVDEETMQEVLDEFDRIDLTEDKDLEHQVRKENLLRVASPNLHAIIENADLNGDGIIDRDEVVKQLTLAMEKVKRFDNKTGSSKEAAGEDEDDANNQD